MDPTLKPRHARITAGADDPDHAALCAFVGFWWRFSGSVTKKSRPSDIVVAAGTAFAASSAIALPSRLADNRLPARYYFRWRYRSLAGCHFAGRDIKPPSARAILPSS